MKHLGLWFCILGAGCVSTGDWERSQRDWAQSQKDQTALFEQRLKVLEDRLKTQEETQALAQAQWSAEWEKIRSLTSDQFLKTLDQNLQTLKALQKSHQDQLTYLGSQLSQTQDLLKKIQGIHLQAQEELKNLEALGVVKKFQALEASWAQVSQNLDFQLRNLQTQAQEQDRLLASLKRAQADQVQIQWETQRNQENSLKMLKSFEQTKRDLAALAQVAQDLQALQDQWKKLPALEKSLKDLSGALDTERKKTEASLKTLSSRLTDLEKEAGSGNSGSPGGWKAALAALDRDLDALAQRVKTLEKR